MKFDPRRVAGRMALSLAVLAISLLAAVPVPDPKFRRTDTIPKGEIPSAIDPPSGCRFHPRCSYAIAECSVKMPFLENAAGDHWVACPVRLKAGGL